MAHYTYNSNEIGWITDQMLDYVIKLIVIINNITKTRLFHDTCGKVDENNGGSIIV